MVRLRTVRTDAAALLGLTALSVFVFWVRVRLDSGFFNGDILTQFIPLYAEVADRLRSGDLPGWNPALFSGMPLAGDPISGWGYGPVMIPFLLFGPLGAYQASVFFHLALAGIATYFLGRRLGMGILGALGAAIAYELGPHAYFTKCCTARMQLGPWIPLGLLAVEMGVRSRSWTGRVLWWGATGIVISQVVAGYFGKGAYYGILTIGAYAAYRTLIDPPESWGVRQRLKAGATHCGAILGFGLALSAVTVLPRLDFLGRANLVGGSYEAVAPGAAAAPGWSVGSAFTNVLNPNDLKYYIGAATFALALAGIILAQRRFAVPFFAVFSAGVLILTLEHTPLHSLLYLLPQFQVIHEHVSSRILVVFNIGPTILAGAAITVIERRLARPPLLGVAALAIVGAAGLVAVIAERDGVTFDPGVRTVMVTVAAMFAAFALLPLLAQAMTPRTASRLPAVAAGLIVVMLLWNLGETTVERARARGLILPPFGSVPLSYTDSVDAGQAGQFLTAATGEDPARYLGYDAGYTNGQQRDSFYYHAFEHDLRTEALLVNNRAVLLGIEDAQGYNPVHAMRYVEFIDALNGQPQEYHETNLLRTGIGSPLLDLLNVRYIVVPAAVPPGRPDLFHLSLRYETVFENGSVRVLERRSALPRAWIVHDTVTMPDAEVLPALAARTVDPTRVALVSDPVSALAPPTDPADDRVEVVREHADRISVTTSTDAPGLLNLSELHDPGWHAYVDGERVEIIRANYLFQAVVIPAGTHVVDLRYEPTSLRNGVVISTATAVLLFLVGGFAVYRRGVRHLPSRSKHSVRT